MLTMSLTHAYKKISTKVSLFPQMKLAAMVSTVMTNYGIAALHKKEKKNFSTLGAGLEPRKKSAKASALIQCTSPSHLVFMQQI